jgi:single-strand DNA-binding protein
MSINRVTLVGRLGKDPEVKRTSNGTLVANLSVACEERWKDKRSGQWEKRTEWVPVVIWTEFLAERVEEQARKGDMIYVEGKFQTRSWDKDGKKQYTTEVVVQGYGGTIELMGARKGGESRDGGDRDDRGRGSDRGDDRRGDDRGSGGRSFGGGGGSRGPRSISDDLDDEIPFAPEFR